MKLSSYLKILILQALVVFHFIEELFFGFPAWATKYFGTTTLNWYLWSHLVLVVMWLIIAFYVSRKNRVALFLVLGIQVLLVTNGLFHILTSLIWWEYSPGVISQMLLIPVSVLLFRKVKALNLFSSKEYFYSALLGVVASLLIIISLSLEIII